MKAVRLHGLRDVRVEDIAVPAAPAPGWVQVAVEAAGICGSDIHNYLTGQWFADLPVTPGHELAGLVTATGQGVDPALIGRRVVADSRVTCGTCAHCREGRGNLCDTLGFVGEVFDGGMAERVNLPARGVHVVPEGVPATVAVLAEPLAVALRAVRRLRVDLARPVLVTGAGTIGGLCAVVLRQLGACDIHVVDRNLDKVRLVAALSGAHHVAAGLAERPRDGQGRPFTQAIEATGSYHVVNWLLENLDKGASLSCVGLFEGNQPLALNHVVERELSVMGASVFADELAEAIAMLPDLAASIAQLVSAPLALAEVPDAYAAIIAGKTAFLKAVVVPTA